jgi:signal transduction histidine kinase
VANFLTRRFPLARELIFAGCGLALVLAIMFVTMSTVWFPLNPFDYVWVAIITAAAWPLSRLAPKSTLAVVAVVASLPWIWVYVAHEVRIVPLAIAAFRAAELGGPKKYVIPIVAAAIPFVLERNLVGNFATGDLLDLGAWRHPSTDIMLVVIVAAIVALGFVVRSQHRIAHNLNTQNAELIALRDSERIRVAIEVQTAIARDIHDVVAHHVAAMVVTAQAADRVADQDPERLRTTVRAIAAEGDEALAAMRRVVQILRRHPDSHAGTKPFETALGELADRLSATGRRVTISGDVAGCTQFVEGTVLRIVQESFTNVMLHSDAARVVVSFAATADDVEVRVDDDGRPSGTRMLADGGSGIRGMRERARSVGGRLDAGPRAEGGWTVHAVLPRAGNAVTV